VVCATCKKWNTGDKVHLMADHIQRAPSAEPTAAANVAQAIGPALSFVAGYVGTIVTSDHGVVKLHDLVKASDKEETVPREWLIVDKYDLTQLFYCICNENYTNPSKHEITTHHFEKALLWNTCKWFAKAKSKEEQHALEARFLEEETLLNAIMQSAIAKEEGDEWAMVSNRSNQKTKKHLNGCTRHR
jgi:hypothetical protein